MPKRPLDDDLLYDPTYQPLPATQMQLAKNPSSANLASINEQTTSDASSFRTAYANKAFHTVWDPTSNCIKVNSQPNLTAVERLESGDQPAQSNSGCEDSCVDFCCCVAFKLPTAILGGTVAAIAGCFGFFAGAGRDLFAKKAAVASNENTLLPAATSSTNSL
jgi:hypothetical protein